VFHAQSSRDYTVIIVPTKKSRRPERVIGHRSNSPSPIQPVFSGKWLTKKSRGLKILQSAAFNKLPWLVHGFSTRPGGVTPFENEKVLNLGLTESDSRENVLENRSRFQSALGATDFTLVPLRQIHSDIIQLFSANPEAPCKGDASVTNTPSLLLAAQTADCVPILLVDPKKRAVAAIHAGWRGTLQRIVAKAIGQMQMHFGTKPSNLLAAIGPAIGGCCYEVGTEVAAQFLSQFSEAPEWFDEFRTGDEPNPVQWLNMMPPGHQPSPKNLLLDLKKANRAQLLEAGLNAKNIFVSDLCTSCRRDLLFSYRKEGPQTGRLMSVIGLKF
jgi:YfiH family protein